jgi:hypothetical protein
MKTYALALAFSAISLSVFATSGPSSSTSSKSSYPKYFVMMKHGKLIEVKHGHQFSVRKDITLTNETTIHPSGAIDAGSGQNMHLHEGQYITMDGKIRYLKDMGRK